MKLCYRGTCYEYTPATVETKVGQLAGKYRGLDWQFCNMQKAPVQQTNVELKYRGVAYKADSSQAPASSAAEKARSLMMSRQRAAEKRQRSQLARSNAEIGLATVAVRF